MMRQDKLLAAEEAIRRSLESTAASYGTDSTAAAMCNLRLGTILLGVLALPCGPYRLAASRRHCTCIDARLQTRGLVMFDRQVPPHQILGSSAYPSLQQMDCEAHRTVT